MLPLFVGLLVHRKTRKKERVAILHDKGIFVSYHSVKEVSTEIANAVLDHHKSTGVVCPPNLKTGICPTGTIDNIDHNPSSVFAIDSFHGTAISLTQHKCDACDNQVRRSHTPIAR